MGGSTQLRQARTLLMTLQSDFADDARNIRDASSLLATVNGRLSRDYGDEAAAADLATSVNKLNEGLGRMTAGTRGTLGTRGSMGSSSSKNANCPDDDDDDNPRVAALNALMQMDAESAMPILEKVMERRDPCSATLRARALWLIVQKRTDRSAQILLDAIRNDPDDEVKQQAVYWLGQVDGSKAIVALEDILRTSRSSDLQASALFALAQNKDPKANAILREYAVRSDIPSDTRSAAIHWLGQAKDDANYAFLKEMFNKVDDSEGKEQIIYSIAQRNTAEGAEWLMNIVMDEKQDVDIRNQALYWAANSDRKNASGNALTDSKLIALYSRLTNSEMKQQLIYAFAQRKDAAFVDKLMDIAKNDKDAELRTTAIYWLGQVASRDPRVMKFLADLING
jgi:HEAT repeat protein